MVILKNILITGGAGFIGSHLALALAAHGYHVTVLDNLSPQIHGKNPDITSPLYQSIKGKVDFINGSVTSRKDWLTALENQDCVVHLAAETGTGQSMYEIERYMQVNVGGTALLLDLLANGKHSVGKVVIASSRAVYGEGKYYCDVCGVVYPGSRKNADMQSRNYECKCPVCGGKVKLLATTEDSLLHPVSVYGVSKQTQEQIVLTVCESLGIAGVALRYQNVYGPGQALSNPYTGVLSVFSNQILDGREINVFEDGKESRDFIYIDDVVNATMLGIEREKADGHVFNIGTGIATDLTTAAKTLIRLFEGRIPLKISGDYRAGDIRHNYADISLARNLLQFEPSVNFNQGLKYFTEWVKLYKELKNSFQ